MVIVDGLGDLPVPALSDRTPLEAARTPVLDRLAGCGRFGLVDPVGRGRVPDTHSGCGILLGMAPEDTSRLRRGPVEACGAGHRPSPGEIALRTNFATLEPQDGQTYVIDRRAGRIRSGTDQLAAALRDIEPAPGVRVTFRATDQHRGVLILAGAGLSPAISDTDPGERGVPGPLPACRALEPGAEDTARILESYLSEVRARLARHPLNADRRAAGKPPATGLITRGAGRYHDMEHVLEQRGIRAALVAGCNTVRGLARMLGFDLLSDPRFTADTDTDLGAKVAAALGALKAHDMVYIHVKAPDILAHDRRPESKREFLEALDRAVEALAGAGVLIALASDHSTDSNTGAHTADPVPALLYDPDQRAGGSANPVNFGEQECRKGNMPRQLSHEFLLRTVAAMAR
jgi:2,3-bisphosphoglycerate-independent phosphoglycerate mutase